MSSSEGNAEGTGAGKGRPGWCASEANTKRTSKLSVTEAALGVTAHEVKLKKISKLTVSEAALGVMAREVNVKNISKLPVTEAAFGVTAHEVNVKKISKLSVKEAELGVTAVSRQESWHLCAEQQGCSQSKRASVPCQAGSHGQLPPAQWSDSQAVVKDYCQTAQCRPV